MITVKQEVKEAQDVAVDDIVIIPQELGLIDGEGGGLVVATVFVKENTVELYGYHLGDLHLVELAKDYKLPLLPSIV